MYSNNSVVRYVKGYILLCRKEGDAEAWIIRQVLGSRYNHSVILLNGYVYEARAGNRIRPIAVNEWRLKHKYAEVKHIPARINMDRLASSQGVRYDLWGCTNHLWLRIFNEWYGAMEGRGTRTFYCFEHCAWVCEMTFWWKASPQKIEGWAKNHFFNGFEIY